MFEYIIITAPSEKMLVNKVNEMIKEGYIPQGGISTYINTSTFVEFVQAMVKEKEVN